MNILEITEMNQNLIDILKSDKELAEKLSESKKVKVISPEGIIYNSVSEAAEVIGVSRPCLSRWIIEKSEKGWKYYKK